MKTLSQIDRRRSLDRAADRGEHATAIVLACATPFAALAALAPRRLARV